MFGKKEKEPREEKVPGKKKGFAIKLLCSVFVAIAIFGVMIGIEQNMMNKYAKEEVIVARTEIPRGVTITEENVATYFELYELDAKLVTDECLFKLSELYGTVTVRNISEKTVLRLSDFTKEEYVYAEFSDPVEASFTAANAGDIVSGTVRRGDRVDVAVIDNETKEYKLFMTDVYVLDAYTSAGEKIEAGNNSLAATMITIVEEKVNVEKFYEALKTGVVIVTRHEAE